MTERQEQMRELVDQWQSSGQSQKEFARDHKLNLHTFKYWIYKFHHKEQTPDGFIRLDEIPASEFCLRYPNGVELMVPTSTPAKVLIDLIRFSG